MLHGGIVLALQRAADVVEMFDLLFALYECPRRGVLCVCPCHYIMFSLRDNGLLFGCINIITVRISIQYVVANGFRIPQGANTAREVKTCRKQVKRVSHAVMPEFLSPRFQLLSQPLLTALQKNSISPTTTIDMNGRPLRHRCCRLRPASEPTIYPHTGHTGLAHFFATGLTTALILTPSAQRKPSGYDFSYHFHSCHLPFHEDNTVASTSPKHHQQRAPRAPSPSVSFEATASTHNAYAAEIARSTCSR